MKRLVAVVLSICLMLSMAQPALAARVKDILEERQEKTLTLENTQDFLEFAENCRLDSYSRELQVELKADLNLAGLDFVGIPIFCGTFLGNGHTISGMYMKTTSGSAGFFGYAAGTGTMRVENLAIVDSYITSNKAIFGGLFGQTNMTSANADETAEVIISLFVFSSERLLHI